MSGLASIRRALADYRAEFEMSRRQQAVENARLAAATLGLVGLAMLFAVMMP